MKMKDKDNLAIFCLSEQIEDLKLILKLTDFWFNY